MTAIAGASAGIKDMADGSLRITIEFEPKDAKAAFELFGSRGTPIACAALKVGFAAVSEPVEPKPEKVKIGPLCREAVDLCKMPEFQQWVAQETVGEDPHGAHMSVQAAKESLCFLCTVDSRKELDADQRSGEQFVKLVRMPFLRWMKTREVKFKEPV